MSLPSDKVLGEESLRVHVSTSTICALLLLPPVGVALPHSDQCRGPCLPAVRSPGPREFSQDLGLLTVTLQSQGHYDFQVVSSFLSCHFYNLDYF